MSRRETIQEEKRRADIAEEVAKRARAVNTLCKFLVTGVVLDSVLKQYRLSRVSTSRERIALNGPPGNNHCSGGGGGRAGAARIAEAVHEGVAGRATRGTGTAGTVAPAQDSVNAPG